MRRALLAPVVLAVFLAACGQQKPDPSKLAKKAPDPIAVRTAQSEARTVERAIMATGSLLADETVTVSSEVSGRVVKISADFGQSVKKGAVIAQLDPIELNLQLERSKAGLAQALARLGLDAKQVDATPESTPTTRQAKAQMEDARTKYENAARLVKSGDVSQERFIELEKGYHAREAAYEATLDDVRQQLAMLRSLRADVRLAEKRVRDATVVAPFDGAIKEKSVSVGQYIRENTGIVTLVKTWPMRLRVEVPESGIGKIKVGSDLAFTTESVPDVEFHATVRELNPSLDSRSRTLTAEARLNKPDERLKPGAFVQVKLITDGNFPVVAVPHDALYTVAGLNKLFTIENGTAVEHKIDTILAANGWVEMPAGLIPAGVPVAVSNLAQLTDGASVTVTGSVK
jgi:RND family efflux transporter MFP subunit